MIYLLDTNAWVVALRRADSPVARQLAGMAAEDVALSAISVVELVRGAYRSARPAYNQGRVAAILDPYTVLPLDRTTAERAGQVDAELTVQGSRIGLYDTLIAATALIHGLTLVTHNTGEFARVAGLQLADWKGP